MMNRFFTLLLAASCLNVVGQVPDYVPTDGLVAWYPLDGDANDVGPNQFVGQLSGSTSYEGHLGNEGGSLWFQEGAFVRSSFPDLTAEQGVTYTAWVQRADSPGIGYIVGYGNSTQLGQSFCLAEGDSYGLFATAIGSSYDAQSNQPLTSSEWVFVATTILNDEVLIYMNGQVVFDGAIAQPSFQSDGDLWIGVSPFNQGQAEFWEGAIDEVGVWSRVLSVAEIDSLFNELPPIVYGCTDIQACNYNESANEDDGTCASCAALATACGEGTVWDADSQTCIVANPSDSNFDGCVQLNDLLDLLSAYGNCGVEESPWQCGDPLEYQGYDYETVQIGEQCWFAENLRAEKYSNGDLIQSDLADEAWTSTFDGAFAVYGEGATDCEGECDEAQNLALYGGLYNWYATVDERALCPQGWHVPSNDDFMDCLLYTSPSPRDLSTSRMPSSA